MIGILSDKTDIGVEICKYFKIKNLYDGDVVKGFPKLDGLFIDWVDGNIFPERFAFQAAVVENYARTRIPVVVFDDSLSMSRREFDWLKKFKVFFFEPAIRNRREFSYMPHWISTPIKNVRKRGDKREIALGYITNNLNDRIKSFEQYYRQISALYPDKKVCYQTSSIDKDKEIVYTRDNAIRINDLNLYDVSMTVLIDNQRNYEVGHLDTYFFEALKNGCVPLLPIEHKFFGNLFNRLVVSYASDVNYIIESFEKISYVLIDDIIKSINEIFPEFLIENVGLKIKECLEK